MCEIPSTADIWKKGISKISVVGIQVSVVDGTTVKFILNSFVDFTFRFSNHTKHQKSYRFGNLVVPFHRISTFPGLQARYSSSIEDVGLAGVKAGEFFGFPTRRRWGKTLGQLIG